MNLIMRSSAVLLCLGFGLVHAAGAAQPGWYFVGSAGEASASVSQGEMDENLVSIFASGGLDVVDSTSTLDDSDTGFGLAGGYQVNDHFALEFSYVDLGSVDYQATSTLTDGTNTGVAETRLESSANGPIVSALGILPIGERFSVFGRVGFSLLNAEGSARITLDGDSQRISQSSQKSDPVFGIGAEFSMTRHFTLRLAWDRYLDVGTADVSGDIDADLITLGIRMGVGWFR
ncbi:MAG TPA: outer membrane beta-barrel protein [Vicinamibacterales bacterium]|nr:outer membrane beta-barrel protein [Vicinamibacterales bacterium]